MSGFCLMQWVINSYTVKLTKFLKERYQFKSKGHIEYKMKTRLWTPKFLQEGSKRLGLLSCKQAISYRKERMTQSGTYNLQGRVKSHREHRTQNACQDARLWIRDRHVGPIPPLSEQEYLPQSPSAYPTTVWGHVLGADSISLVHRTLEREKPYSRNYMAKDLICT